ncbi:GFA family protein [Rhodococcus sp. AQ5-07]|uniref:GFA family protein n=1 Tax=Rhodococcus sp. AQ5-07 TaxID=2054902 RepID=UPI000DBF6A18|nr:GFA family protein [Rhodococcus sp. AQ5-07]RAL30917.1 GFA family protein [Rhodococcus sp. AQ5-07]
MAELPELRSPEELIRDGYVWVDGACHCQNVQFSALFSKSIIITRCNCGICYKSGHQELLVHESRFELKSGREFLKEYRFGDFRADHTFCVVCGIMPFYRPKSNPDSYSVNARCIDLSFATQTEWCDFDGKNWQASIDKGMHRATQ